MPSVRIKKPKPVPVMHMIVHGRRALGESWRKITVGHDGDNYTIENNPTEAPADGRPIFVPTLGEVSLDMADYILEYQRKEAEYRKAKALPGWCPTREEIQRLFEDYVEQRLKSFRGQSVIGPGIAVHREKIG